MIFLVMGIAVGSYFIGAMFMRWTDRRELLMAKHEAESWRQQALIWKAAAGQANAARGVTMEETE